jgi:hypothetical protein
LHQVYFSKIAANIKNSTSGIDEWRGREEEVRIGIY